MKQTTKNSHQGIFIDLMDAFHDAHQKKIAHQKEDKNKRKNIARRAIEVYQEEMQLKLAIHEWWEDI